MIYANENRYVTTDNVVGFYLNADMDDFVAMKIEGMMVDYMAKAEPQTYFKYMRTYNNKKLLYVKIVKAL